MNTIILVGNVGREPEMTYTPDGLAVTKFSIADSLPKKKGAAEGETQWFNVVCFGKQAEVASQYVHKGSKIYIQGMFHARAWSDPATGKSGTSMDVRLEKLQLLDRKPAEAGAAPAGEVPADDSESFPF